MRSASSSRSSLFAGNAKQFERVHLEAARHAVRELRPVRRSARRGSSPPSRWCWSGAGRGSPAGAPRDVRRRSARASFSAQRRVGPARARRREAALLGAPRGRLTVLQGPAAARWRRARLRRPCVASGARVFDQRHGDSPTAARPRAWRNGFPRRRRAIPPAPCCARSARQTSAERARAPASDWSAGYVRSANGVAGYSSAAGSVFATFLGDVKADARRGHGRDHDRGVRQHFDAFRDAAHLPR